ncbi:unnamed protein product [Trichobilharzia szidati]|nr:unnamed protein product [Trichobilharzia szidati]
MFVLVKTSQFVSIPAVVIFTCSAKVKACCVFETMTGTCITAHEKFTKLRKRLDQLGYKQPLGLDSLPLVERLFCDLVWTTENLRKVRTELSSQIQIRSTVEDYIAPYKADNGKLIRENNEIHHRLMTVCQDYEEKFRGLKSECRRLENENEDMKYFNSQCLDKIHTYEREAKRMVEQILHLQEKNFQAVVYTPDGNKKQLPFRRQRMDIDSLVPPSKETKNMDDSANYCCSIARMWEKTKGKDFPKVLLRDTEIERLRNISEKGRPLETLLNDCSGKQSDRLIHQLQLQVDLLQARNGELEARIVELVNREVASIQPSPDLVNAECQTLCSSKLPLVDNSCQTNSVDTIYCPNHAKPSTQFKKEIYELIQRFENSRKCVTQRLHSIVTKDQNLLNDLSRYIPSSFHGQTNSNGEEIIKFVEKHLHITKGDRDYCYSELEVISDILKHISAYLLTKCVVNKLKISDLPKPPSGSNIKMNSCSRRQLRRSKSAEVHGIQSKDCKLLQGEVRCLQTERDHYQEELEKSRLKFHRLHMPRIQCIDKNSFLEDEVKCLLQERNDLAALLNHFERQLHDIQGNVRVLTSERDTLVEQLSQVKFDLSEANKCLLEAAKQKEKCIHDNPTSVSNCLHSCIHQRNQKLDAELCKTVQNLHLMTTERNSLREQLNTLTTEYVNEKAHLLQCLEDNKRQLESVKQNEHLLEQRIAELTKSVVDTKSERDKLIEKLNCLENHYANTDQISVVERNLQTVQTHLEKVQRDYEKSRNECTSLYVTLRQLDQEKDHLQTCLDGRTERCIALERQLAIYETQVKDLKTNIETSEKQVIRLTQSIVERETENRELVERLSKTECDLKSTSKNQETLIKEIEKTKADMEILVGETQRLQAEINSSYEKQSELVRRVADSEKELTSVRDQCSSKEQERAELLKEYRTLAFQLDEKITLINRLENQLKDLDQIRSVQEKELSDLREQSQKLKNECSNYAQVVQSLEVQLSLLKRTASDSEQRVSRLQTENEEIRRDLTDTRNLCDRLERQGNSFQHQYTISNLEVNQLKAKLCETEREITDLRKQVDHEHEALRSFESILGSSREAEHTAQLELRECRAEVYSLRERLSAKEAALLESENEIAKLNRQLLSLQKQPNNPSPVVTIHVPNRGSPVKSVCENNINTSKNEHLNNCNNVHSNIDLLPSPTSSIELPIEYSVRESITSPVSCSAFRLDSCKSQPAVTSPGCDNTSVLTWSNPSVFIPSLTYNSKTSDSVNEQGVSLCKLPSSINNFLSNSDLNLSQIDDSGRPVSEDIISSK